MEGYQGIAEQINNVKSPQARAFLIIQYLDQLKHKERIEEKQAIEILRELGVIKPENARPIIRIQSQTIKELLEHGIIDEDDAIKAAGQLLDQEVETKFRAYYESLRNISTKLDKIRQAILDRIQRLETEGEEFPQHIGEDNVPSSNNLTAIEEEILNEYPTSPFFKARKAYQIATSQINTIEDQKRYSREMELTEEEFCQYAELGLLLEKLELDIHASEIIESALEKNSVLIMEIPNLILQMLSPLWPHQKDTKPTKGKKLATLNHQNAKMIIQFAQESRNRYQKIKAILEKDHPKQAPALITRTLARMKKNLSNLTKR